MQKRDIPIVQWPMATLDIRSAVGRGLQVPGEHTTPDVEVSRLSTLRTAQGLKSHCTGCGSCGMTGVWPVDADPLLGRGASGTRLRHSLRWLVVPEGERAGAGLARAATWTGQEQHQQREHTQKLLEMP